MARSLAEFEAAMAFIRDGRSDHEIETLTGVHRGTVGAWRHVRGVVLHERHARARRPWRPPSPSAYSYLLGVYLGDGHIVISSARSARLVITLDVAYPGVADEVRAAMEATFPMARTTSSLRTRGSCLALQVADPAMPLAFPQHGPGRKHERAISLSGWQREITRANSRSLLRGLIHSDGCRTVNRFRTKLPSGEHCELLGIRWTQSNPRNISVSHRRSVALLDEFVGPKT